jgi:sterol desaturase/sphingolipid hydroxylase (fatty acid hydroxylase superfamily)
VGHVERTGIGRDFFILDSIGRRYGVTPQQAQMMVATTVLLGFAAAELWRGRFFAPEATREDDRLDLVVTLAFPLTSGLVLFLANAACEWWLPESRGALAHWPWWAMIATLLVGDDLTQYLWHRLSHTSLMWPLHRAHHSAAYMSVRVVYRNNFFYYLFMPGLWISGVLLYLGFGWVYVAYASVKLAAIIGAHSSVRWDETLYRSRLLRPVAWVLERTISTPATHFAHHALSQDDGIGHYGGNYGNLLFLWDVIFGTARITRRYPPSFGLTDDRAHGPESWATQFLYPLRRSRRAGTALTFPPGTPPA